MRHFLRVSMHSGTWRTLCGAQVKVATQDGPNCKRCEAAYQRQKDTAARSNTERSAGRIPRTPGR